jgi:ribonuclease Z
MNRPQNTSRSLSRDWKIMTGASVAGQSTSILLLQPSTRRRLLLDIGLVGVPAVLTADVVLVSHGHTDHCGGIFTHARARQQPATYVVPEAMLPALKQAREAFEQMDQAPMKMNIRAAQVGELMDLGGGMFVKAVATKHRVPSVGYLVYRQERRIKPEFASLAPVEKERLGRAGTDMYEAVFTLELAYSGDCTADALPDSLLTAPLCFVECTYLGLQGDKDSREAAEEHGHVLLPDLEQRCAKVAECGQQLVLFHFSARYAPKQIVEQCARAKLFARPVALLLRSFQVKMSKNRDDDAFVVGQDALGF